jgi:hypothetical protein
MTLLVSQDDALRQLRLSAAAITPDELADVLFKAEQASDIVVDYLKAPGSGNYVTDNPVVNPLRRARSRWRSSRDGSMGGDGGDWWGGGWLPDVGWGGDFGPPPGPPPPLRVPQSPWDETSAPVMIKGVVLILLTALYDGRTPGDDLLSDQMCRVLERYRDPALA